LSLPGSSLPGLSVPGLSWRPSPPLAGLAMPLVGSVHRLDLLAPGGIVASGSTPSTSRPGCWGLAAWPAGGRRRAPSRRRHRPAGPGVLHRQAEGNPAEGPEQRPIVTRRWPRRRTDWSTGPPRLNIALYVAEAACAQTCAPELIHPPASSP
jgi:hypothetical protein